MMEKMQLNQGASPPRQGRLSAQRLRQRARKSRSALGYQGPGDPLKNSGGLLGEPHLAALSNAGLSSAPGPFVWKPSPLSGPFPDMGSTPAPPAQGALGTCSRLGAGAGQRYARPGPPLSGYRMVFWF